MSLLKEFKDFAFKGNVLDMAVGIIIGVAFGKVVSSLVKDVIMPPIGKLMGGVNFSNLFVNLGEKTGADGKEIVSLAQAQEAGLPVIAYGQFFNTVIDFVIVAFCIFMVIKVFNAMKRKPEPAPAAPKEPPAEEKLLTEIRDLLKKG